MELQIKHTKNYTGIISIDGMTVETLMQSFDENGLMCDGANQYVIDREKYYANIDECRAMEDEFKKEMRRIEDLSIKEVINDVETEK